MLYLAMFLTENVVVPGAVREHFAAASLQCKYVSIDCSTLLLQQQFNGHCPHERPVAPVIIMVH